MPRNKGRTRRIVVEDELTGKFVWEVPESLNKVLKKTQENAETIEEADDAIELFIQISQLLVRQNLSQIVAVYRLTKNVTPTELRKNFSFVIRTNTLVLNKIRERLNHEKN